MMMINILSKVSCNLAKEALKIAVSYGCVAVVRPPTLTQVAISHATKIVVNTTLGEVLPKYMLMPISCIETTIGMYGLYKFTSPFIQKIVPGLMGKCVSLGIGGAIVLLAIQSEDEDELPEEQRGLLDEFIGMFTPFLGGDVDNKHGHQESDAHVE
jgi:hypothetical protein